jgi:hypothetical protein
MSATIFRNVSLYMFSCYTSLRKRAKNWQQYCLRLIRVIWPFPPAVLILRAWEFMGLYWVYTSSSLFVPQCRAWNVFQVLLHNLIHELFLFPTLEAFFSLSSLITENTFDVQMFLWVPCIPHSEYGTSIAMEIVIIKGILYREIKTGNVHIK